MGFGNSDVEATNEAYVKEITLPVHGCLTLKRSHDMFWYFPGYVKFLKNLMML